MKALLAAVLLCVSCGARAQGYRLPFDGRWFALQGGDTLNVNHHMRVRAQWYGIDFAKVGGPSGRALSKQPKPDEIENFYSWGAPVRSPVDGAVIRVTHELPDNPLGVKDERNPAGNYVVIQAGGDRYVFLAHFQHQSIVVRAGQRVGRSVHIGNAAIPIVDFSHLPSRCDRMELFDGFRFDESRLLRCKNALFAEYHYAV